MEALVKCVFGGKGQLGLDFGGINGVAAVVAFAVRDMGDQGAGVDAAGAGAVRVLGGQAGVGCESVVHQVTDHVDNVQVGLFVVAADVVYLTGPAFFQDQVHALVVIVHV